MLVMELTAAPGAMFATEKAAVVIESHWLGGRRMYGRWEIADIALLILVRRLGVLAQRKVALLQTKRLYSREISVEELGTSEYDIGIGRLGDGTDRAVSLVAQRRFSFHTTCVYGALRAGAEQTQHIDAYVKQSGIPVFYAFYNPVQLPYSGAYPAPGGQGAGRTQCIGVPSSDLTSSASCSRSPHYGASPNFHRPPRRASRPSARSSCRFRMAVGALRRR